MGRARGPEASPVPGGESPIAPDDRTLTSPGDAPRRRSRRSPRESGRLGGGLRALLDLAPELLQSIDAAMVERTFAAGEFLMRQGEPGDSLMVVQEGDVEVVVQVDGSPHVLQRAGALDVFGEMALLTHEPRTASVIARTPVRALVLPADDFHRLASAEPALAEVLSRLTAQRLGEASRDALAGKQFHGYTIRRRLGRGGMAVVYEAEEANSGRRVALKMMSHRLVFRQEHRRRFRQEADLVGSFDHENIARMLGRFEAFHTFFIVMEYCDGPSLDRLLEVRGALEETTVRKILGQLAAALRYAHARRVVHRDITPANVLLRRDGVVKLTDFGIALALPREGGAAAGAVAGTVPYLAPEQLANEPCGFPADLYAVGGLAWQMLTGRPLFDSGGFTALREAHLRWKVPPIDGVRPGLDARLRELLDGTLVRDPAGRRLDLEATAAWAAPLDPAELDGVEP